MRIGLVLTGFDGGGAQRRLLTLARGFLAAGHDVEILVGDDAGPFRNDAPAGATVVPLKNALHRIPGLSRRKSLRMLAALPALAARLRHDSPDVLLGGSTPANLCALAAREMATVRGRQAPAVAVSVNVPLSRSTTIAARPALGRLVRRFYPHADAVIANASALASDAVALCGLEPGRVAVIANPIDVQAIEARAAEAAAHPWLRDRGPGHAARAGEVPVLLAVGKLKTQKDWPTLLRAFRRVLDRRPARLLVLGSGEKRDELVAMAATLGLGDNVDFAGFDANPFAGMARADLFVSSSRWEGFSNVLAEALACGCPVVATDCPGGVAELLAGGRFGALVAPGDDVAMARAIVATLESPPPRECQAGRARQFSVDRATRSYLRVLRGIAVRAGDAAQGADPGHAVGAVGTRGAIDSLAGGSVSVPATRLP